jgi:DNA-directed RNA polymerase III subunit RPC3
MVLKATINATIDQQIDIDESVARTWRPAVLADNADEAVTTTVILNNLSTSQLKQLPHGLTSAPKGKDIALVEAYVQILSADDARSEFAASFLEREGDTNTAAYRVQFDRICTQLKAAVLSKLVKEKLSEKAARILQILIRGKKLSEQQVGSSILLSFGH